MYGILVGILILELAHPRRRRVVAGGQGGGLASMGGRRRTETIMGGPSGDHAG